MAFDPASRIQEFLAFGEFGDVNPSITDSSTYTFMSAQKMEELFEHDIEGCFLYSRHWNPTNKYLADALARMEDGESAQAVGSGMAAISSTLLQLCSAGDEIVAGRTIYGGTYALLKNLLPRFGITTRFVDVGNLAAVRAAITDRTRVLFCESISNPLLDVSDLPALSALARERGLRLVVDNTFSPMILSPLRLGADVVVHSMTKFINGTSDCVAGCVVASREHIARMCDINDGPSMLMGPVPTASAPPASSRTCTASTSACASMAQRAGARPPPERRGLPVHYPGLERHPQHALMNRLMNPGYGYGGMLAVDVGDHERACRLMIRMQEEKVGYLAVSLGYFKTLFSAPGHSTSSEIPAEEQRSMGLSEGLIRFSIGLDNDMEQTCGRIERCLDDVGARPARPSEAATGS
jgi:methionine-gamma-lyase